jgi:tetratricopeptide (TPR) repeat protein
MRRRFGAAIAISRHAVALTDAAALWLDAGQLQTATANLSHEPGDLATWDAMRARQLDHTLALYRGDFLQGHALSHAPRFEAWVKYQQAKFKGLVHRAYSILCDYYLAAGDDTLGRDAAQRWVAVDPLDPTAQRALIQVEAEAGRTQDALHLLDQYQQSLHDLLHIAPDPELQMLYRSLQRLGGAPVGKSAVPPPPNNIEPPATPLLGRQNELWKLMRLISSRSQRRVTVSGDDGLGKTHLVQTLAGHLLEDAGVWQRFPDGVFWLTWPAAHGEDDLLQMLAMRAGLGQPEAGVESAGQVVAALATSALLLILDDVTLTPTGRALLDRLLCAAPGVVVLLTARTPLGLAGEFVMPLCGLALPPSTADTGLETSAAYQLLMQHAAAPKTSLTPETAGAVGRICRATGGAPLALRLAGALTATYTWPDLADLLEARGATTPAAGAAESICRQLFTLAWRGMDKWLQRAYLRLALFDDAFSEQTASAAALVMPNHLALLVEHALIEQTAADGAAARYRLHPLLRRIAQGQAGDSVTGAAAYHWHAGYFARFVKRHDPTIGDDSLPTRLEALGAELGEIRTAFIHAAQQQRWAMIGEIAPSIAHYFVLSGNCPQGQRLFDDVIDKAEAGRAGDAALAVLYAARAMIHNRRSAYRAASADARAAMEHRAGDRETETLAELEWGRAAFHLGEFSEARLHLERALALARGAELLHWEVRALAALGLALLYSGEHIRGVQLTYTALHLSQKHQFRLDEVRLLNQLGMVFYYQGRYATAQQHYLHALRGAETIGSAATMIAARISLGAIAYQLGDAAGARDHYEAALERMHTCGERGQEALVIANIGLVAHQLGDQQTALARLAQAERLAVQRGQRDSEAFALTWQGEAHLACAQLDLAEDCFGKALQVRQALGQGQQAMEPLAGLVQVALERQDTTAACALVDRILPSIQSPSFVAAVNVFGLYWRCFQALQRAGDGRADEILAAAYHSLLARAGPHQNKTPRRRDLEQIPVHRAIIEAYRHRAEAAGPKPG